MKLLLDAHTLYWAIYEPEKLSKVASEAIADPANALFVSLATVWEMASKVAADRVPLAGSSVERMIKRIKDLDVTLLPITEADIVAAATLPQHHGDPFDRILIAQAQVHLMHLVSKDAKIALYDVLLLWN